jgi:type II secretory pathway component PulF
MSDAALLGRPISTVLGRYPSAFNQTTVALLQAGEESGLMEQAADRLAKYYDRIFQLEQVYRWQTFYPKVLLIALIVIPTVPALVLGSFSGWLRLVLSRALPGLLAIAALWYGWRALRRSSAFSEAVDHVKLALPWFGNLARRIATARWARALATLLSAGVPVHRALVASAAASGNKAMEASLVKEAQGVLEGRTLTEVVTASRAVPPLALDLLAAAERAGSYEGALDKIAEYYESETEVGGKQTALAVGVLLYLLVAALIGFTVLIFYRAYFAGLTKYME